MHALIAIGIVATGVTGTETRNAVETTVASIDREIAISTDPETETGIVRGGLDGVVDSSGRMSAATMIADETIDRTVGDLGHPNAATKTATGTTTVTAVAIHVRTTLPTSGKRNLHPHPRPQQLAAKK